MRIYVGNLNYKSTREEIQELFEEFGLVTQITLLTDATTGNSKGTAFVEMSDFDGERAIEGLNGAAVMGRKLTVNVARPRTGDMSSQPPALWQFPS